MPGPSLACGARAGRPSCSKEVSTLGEHGEGLGQEPQARDGVAKPAPAPEAREAAADGACSEARPERPAAESTESPGEAAPTGTPDGALKEAPEAELVRAREQLARLETQLRRLMADFDNYRRRTRAEAERAADEALERMARPLLSVVDDLELTVAAIPEGPAWSSVAAGIRMVHQKLLAALEAAGIHAVAAAGEPFDPAVHQAVDAVEVSDPSQEGRVVEELRRGFILKGRVLRPALVKVGVLRRSHEEPEPPQAQQPARSQATPGDQEGIDP